MSSTQDGELVLHVLRFVVVCLGCILFPLPPVTNMDALGSKANLASSCRANSERDWICFMFLSLMGELFFLFRLQFTIKTLFKQIKMQIFKYKVYDRRYNLEI